MWKGLERKHERHLRLGWLDMYGYIGRNRLRIETNGDGKSTVATPDGRS